MNVSTERRSFDHVQKDVLKSRPIFRWSFCHYILKIDFLPGCAPAAGEGSQKPAQSAPHTLLCENNTLLADSKWSSLVFWNRVCIFMENR